MPFLNMCLSNDQPESTSIGQLHRHLFSTQTKYSDKDLCFPPCSGHYHLPHDVPSAPHITYVGSPYQVGAGEAGEMKRLLVLRAPHWKVLEQVGGHAGGKHQAGTPPIIM